MADKFLKTLKLPGINEPYKIPQTAEDVGARPDTWMPTAEDVNALPISGGTMNGALNMNSQPLWGLANPTGDDQPVTYRMHLDDLATKAPNIGKGAYTGDVNIVGDNGVPINSALWVSQAANLPSGHQQGVLETWVPQPGAILQRFSSSDGGVFWREYFHNGVSEGWHIGWQRLDNKECAPAGYGLGEAAPRQVNSLDEVTSAGWYRKWFELSELPAGATHGTKSFRVGDFYDANNLEIILPINNSYTDYTVLTNLRRRKSGGVWLDWEWENPNMNFGIEYRTTERYDGKPVYRKLIKYTNTTTMGNISGSVDYYIPHGISGFSELVELNAKYGTRTMIPYPTYKTISGTVYGSVSGVTVVSDANIVMRITNDTFNPADWVFSLAYTKS